MGGKMEQYFNAALKNIGWFGDTDILPFPIENQLFLAERPKVVAILNTIHQSFRDSLHNYHPINQSMLTPVGYSGFRWATQIDPLWNAYFLGLVISIGERIESSRIAQSRGIIFSYRFKLDKKTGSIFDRASGWVEFQRKSVEHASKFRSVLMCDISDFYPRVYHHRLENALNNVAGELDVTWRIMRLLKSFSKNVSYGLPVGGPAARLLSELLLNRVDRLLLSEGITFCRFADDYHIFAGSEEEAYRNLVSLSTKLLENEGLLLQKAKTRIMSSEEFLLTSEFSDQNIAEDKSEEANRDFLKLRLFYDPYSKDEVEAARDYEALKAELSRFDIVGMLAKEMRKGRVHQALTRKLLAAVQHLEPPIKSHAVRSLINPDRTSRGQPLDNLSVLYPIFHNVAILIKSILPELDIDTRRLVFERIRKLIDEGSYILAVPSNLAYAIRLLAFDDSEEADNTLSSVFRSSTNLLIRREVILAMARRGADFWISDIKNSFEARSSWERSAILVASFILARDEGDYWRSSVKGNLNQLQRLLVDWAKGKVSRSIWEIHL